ncbi:MAG: DUF3891 family protein [Gaiellaceae bacterium]
MSFHSRRRSIVFPQVEHAHFAGELASQWRDRPPLPFESFVRGVAEHDRGYGELDDAPLGAVESASWVEIQRRGFTRHGEDPVTDLVVALHVRRLLASRDDAFEEAAYAEVDALVPSLLAAAGVVEADAETADAITNVCDVLSLLFCFESAAEREVRGFRLASDGLGRLSIAPWPFVPGGLTGEVPAYDREGYPQRLARLAVPHVLEPA